MHIYKSDVFAKSALIDSKKKKERKYAEEGVREVV